MNILDIFRTSAHKTITLPSSSTSSEPDRNSWTAQAVREWRKRKGNPCPMVINDEKGGRTIGGPLRRDPFLTPR